MQEQQATETPRSLFPFILSARCYPDNKNQPHKTGPHWFLLPQPASWVLGMGLEWEAGIGQRHWEEMKIGSEREVP